MRGLFLTAPKYDPSGKITAPKPPWKPPSAGGPIAAPAPGEPGFIERCYKQIPRTPWSALNIDLEDWPLPIRRTGDRERLHDSFERAFRLVFSAWSFVKWLKELPAPQVAMFYWDKQISLPGRPAVSLKDEFGSYSRAMLEAVFDGYSAIGAYFTSKSNPMTLIGTVPTCEDPSVFIDPGSRAMALCQDFWDANEHKRAREIMWSVAWAATGQRSLGKKYSDFANNRERALGSCLVPQVEDPEGLRPRCPGTPGAIVWFVPSGRGKSKCTSSETNTVIASYEEAFRWVDAAKRFLDGLAALSGPKRRAMWDRGHLPVGSVQSHIAYDEDDSYFNHWSPSNWFGLYDDSVFDRVRDRVIRLWLRFQFGTKKNSPVEIVCRSHRNCWLIAGAYHSPTSVGEITLCEDWFDTGSFLKRTSYLLHEMQHYLVDDSASTNRPKDVRHDACKRSGKFSTVCYEAKYARRLLRATRSEATQNIDNYTYWMRYFFAFTQGCWPERWISHGYYQEPQTWAPPPAGSLFPFPPRI